MATKPNRFRYYSFRISAASAASPPGRITDEKNLQTCLHCDKAKCNGNCERMRGKGKGKDHA